VIFGIAYKSADLAIKTQYIIMAVIAAAIIAIVLAAYYGSMQYHSIDVIKWGSFQGSVENKFSGSNFWMVFAVFFPAATGIMAGANMSGELKNPQKSIPVGTLWAIGISFIVYMGLAYWVARTASTEELLTNYNVIIDKSIFPPLVIAGVLGATFSSALASMVGSSRILFAMGTHGVLPKSTWLGKVDKTGQPRNAMFITGGLVFLSMLLRDLNAVAPLVTMFFLITYAMLNVVVIIEQKLGLISFRPLFNVPKVIPWIGLITSVLAMFIINPTISLISVALVVLMYGILSQRQLVSPFEDVRSGLFVSFAEWAAKHTSSITQRQERAWKPNLLIPISDSHSVKGIFSFLKNVAYPKGSIKLLGIGSEQNNSNLTTQINKLSMAFQQRKVFSSWAVIRTGNFANGVNYANQAYRGAFFRPNIVFLSMVERESREQDFKDIIRESERLKLGVMVYSQHIKSGLGQRQVINVWIKNRAPNYSVSWDLGNIDLSILIAYKLKKNWAANIRLVMVVENEEQATKTKQFMKELVSLARLPKTERCVHIGVFDEFIANAPDADLNIFGLHAEPDFDSIETIVNRTQTTCLFIRDSGMESIFA